MMLSLTWSKCVSEASLAKKALDWQTRSVENIMDFPSIIDESKKKSLEGLVMPHLLEEAKQTKDSNN